MRMNESTIVGAIGGKTSGLRSHGVVEFRMHEMDVVPAPEIMYGPGLAGLHLGR